MPTLITDDGVEIRYETWGGGDGPLVVLHHGFSVDLDREWVDSGMAAALVAAGRRVVAHDARGHGRSGKLYDCAAYGEERMAADVMALVDHLGEPGFDLVGYSMGAIVALLVAARDDRVRRLFIGGVGAGVVELGGLEPRVLPPAAIRDAMLTDDPSTIEDPGARSFRAGVDESGSDRLALAAVAGAVHRTPIPLDDVTVPTLLTVGRDDDLAPRPQVLVDALPHADLLVLDGDHGSVLRTPEFIAAMIEHLAG